ncbi:MAG: energy transducer TonB [Leeuwenhoekiella sp.]
MKNSYESDKSVRQNRNRATSKHDVNLQKNNIVYFQVGLIVALLLVIFAVELKTEEMAYVMKPHQEIPDSVDFKWDETFEVEKQKEVENKIIQSRSTLPPEVIEDDKPVVDENDIFQQPEPLESDVIDISSLKTIDDAPIESVDYRKVEFVPVYPGCEGLASNEERKSCMQQKISKLISKNFDTSVGTKYNLNGVNRIDVQFTVDENGDVKAIKTRASHPALEEEARRVINKIPQMIPGKQQNKNVRVIYGQPILFKLDN